MDAAVRQLIESAVKHLGPERCQSALAAFTDPSPNGWEGCVLARAYGARRALLLNVECLHLEPGITATATLLGLPNAEVSAIQQTFDNGWLARRKSEALVSPEEALEAFEAMWQAFEAEAAKCSMLTVAPA